MIQPPKQSNSAPRLPRLPWPLWVAMVALCFAMGTGHAHAQARALRLEPRAEIHRFALIVGSNATLDEALTPLRFADDDAAKMAELLLEVGVDVELVTALDRESQALHPDLVRGAIRPTKKGLNKAWKRLLERMKSVPDAHEVELLIYYSGHGDVGADGRGYLTLQGDKLTRDHLFGTILSQSVADYNHVLIDACRSEQFVLTRGKTWRPDREPKDATDSVRSYLDKNHLGGFPNTGVIIAHSADQQTHEWERYRGGIFTHELLSGLRGGADLNGDGNIEYSELGAFVAAANSGVRDPRARLSVVVRPPKSDERHALLGYPDLAKQRVLLFSQGDGELYTLEDERGVRLADLRRSGSQPAYLRLPAGDIFVTRKPEGEGTPVVESHIPAHDTGIARAQELEFKPSERAARGALDQAFRSGLFAKPFSEGYYSGYTDQRGLLAVKEPRWHVEVWEIHADGTRVKVSESAVATSERAEAYEVEVDDDDQWWDRGSTWGGLTAGVIFAPFNASGTMGSDPKRVTSNQFQACLGPFEGAGCSVIRGFDLRWNVFRLRRGAKNPRALGYFRTGYTAGTGTFAAPEGQGGRHNPGQATSLSYVTVPLFFGGNIYVFDEFPLRPYAGMGAGFDVLYTSYDRFEQGRRTDASARIGFELHGGIELRLVKTFAMHAEVMQLWSARRKLGGVPDFSNEGFTVLVGATFNLRLRGSRPPRRTRVVVRPKRAPKKPVEPASVPVSVEPAPAPLAPEPPEAPLAPAPPEAVVAPDALELAPPPAG